MNFLNTPKSSAQSLPSDPANEIAQKIANLIGNQSGLCCVILEAMLKLRDIRTHNDFQKG